MKAKPRALAYDCTRCGACCFNPPENLAEGFSEYVEVGPRDMLRQRPDLVQRYTVKNTVKNPVKNTIEKDGRLHMRIMADQRCMALAGRMGHKVRCTIYHARPSPCRRVEAGSELCVRYRRGQGLV